MWLRQPIFDFSNLANMFFDLPRVTSFSIFSAGEVKFIDQNGFSADL